MIGAFTYLILTSARGRIRAQLARLRNPRYALSLAIGLFYVWAVYLRPTQHPEAARQVLGGTIGTIAPLLALLYVAWTWLFGADRNALAFSEAEATMLFTAPVSRRGLVSYKIARTQLTILTTSLIWTIIFRQGRSPALAITHVIGYWVLLSALNLNRLGVALIRSSAGEHGLRGARRHWVPVGVAAAIVAMVVVPVYATRDQLAAAGMAGAGDVLTRALGSTSAAIALLPFHLLVAPLSAAPGRAWLGAIVPALLILVLLALWVLHTDAAFEEAATEASKRQAERVAAMRARRAGGIVAPKMKVRRTMPLASVGPPAWALVWKNTMWLLRTGQIPGLVAPPAIAFLCVALFAHRSPRGAMVIAVVSLIVAGVMMLFGPMSMRNDLRSELLRLPLLKTFPLRGHEIVLAEVASSAIPVALMQYLMALAALVALGFTDTSALPGSTRAVLAVAGLAMVLGVNAVMFMIHNGLAVLFPGWVKLGATGATGVETIGMGMLTMIVVLVMLSLALIVPVVAGAIAWVLLRSHLDAAMLVGGVAAGLLLLAEAAMFAYSLGGSIERVEPMQVES